MGLWGDNIYFVKHNKEHTYTESRNGYPPQSLITVLGKCLKITKTFFPPFYLVDEDVHLTL